MAFPNLLVYMAILLLHSICTRAIEFTDVSAKAGLDWSEGPSLKYGGAAVADVDGDGFPDLLFGHHNAQKTELYFNQRDGTFKRSTWRVSADVHGISPFRYSPWQRRMHIVVTRGGANGDNPQVPLIFRVGPQRAVVDITRDSGVVPGAAARGRSAVFLNLRTRSFPRPDVLFTSVRMPDITPNHHTAFQLNQGEKFVQRNVTGGYLSDPNVYGTVADIDGDGRVELLSYHWLRVYSVISPFGLKDVTMSVLPRVDWRGGVGIAELDFDNDGRWDLYVARTEGQNLHWLQGTDRNDRLLRNVGGRFVDVSEAAGIPRGTLSRGVTAGDFDNDGWVDLLVTRYDAPDLLLRNRGDGTFETRDAGFKRMAGVSGDMVTAVDLDRDGRLDVVLCEGDWLDESLGGHYHIMKNTASNIGNYLLVRVMNAPNRRTTSLHAVVTVVVNGRSMMRRVGSPGTAVSVSYIELLHFGLGKSSKADSVVIQWTDGQNASMTNVLAGKLVTFGV